VVKSSVNRTFANKYSLRIAHGPWITYGGFKAQKDHRGAPDEWVQAGIQRRLGRHLGIGYEYGRYRYSHSGILQLFF
jgi:hypothetical protein